MRSLWNEYAGAIIGFAGAVMVTGFVTGLFLHGGSIYRAIVAFSGSIC